MEMRGTFKLLGTGGSMGIPVLGCLCKVCTSNDPKNRRSRPSALVMLNGKNYLIDTSPDLRAQFLKNGIEDVDGVLITHTHYDHIAGLDDLRPLYYLKQEKTEVLLTKEGHLDLSRRFAYLTKPEGDDPYSAKYFHFHPVEESGKTEFCGLKIDICEYKQAGMRVLGFRFGDLAYLTDICDYTDEIYDHLKGVKTLVISAPRFEAEKSAVAKVVHLSIEEAIAISKKIGAEKTYLTHIAHTLDHAETNKLLPENVQLAHDGLELTFLAEK